MADAIRRALNIEPILIEGRGGVFDVEVDGERVFSKHATGRFPEHEEILRLLRERSRS
ncbi:MAG: SelT/SelW/SelH family protein [Planctomycetota bacterium]|nr:MAG: SelT/SelW/SelH family protein [Planctomycetota bacterium]